MESAVRARNAGREAVRSVSPDQLRERIYALLDESAVLPGVLTLTSAHAVDPTAEGHRVEERAAGVQLIYEGLRLTRALADATPWEHESPHTDSNVDILAADVMVARGFSLLADTEAADKAVETVRSFGRDQTDDHEGRPTEPHALERDVFELAVIAGTTAVDGDPSDDLLSYAGELADSLDGDRPEPPEPLPEEVEQTMSDAPDPCNPAPADDPRRSATDP